MRVAGSLLAAALVVACGTRPAETALRPPAHCEADATLVTAEPATLEVSLECHGRTLRAFTASEEQSAPHISEIRDAHGSPLARAGDSFRLAKPSNDVRIRYRVALDAIAADADSFDVALRAGQTLVTATSTWLLAPDPLFTDMPVTLRVHAPPGVGFTTGLERRGDAWTLGAHEIPVATYALFGHFDSHVSRIPGSTAHGTGESALEVAVADGPLEVERDDLLQWVDDSARAVGRFWHGFPVKNALITLIPVRGRGGVLFGKVLPESSPGIVVLVGEHTSRARLYDDWILVHELFHLGVPSFYGEGKWFDEGLATYFEPIIRARAGFRREEDVWAEFVRAMPLGLAAVNEKGLERANDFGEVYWGGAIVVMLADVEIRRATNGARGLEDGLRGVLDAGGDASEVWPLDRTLALSDKSCGVSALEPLARAHARRAEHVDLETLWRELGIERRASGVALRQNTPLAGVRHAIVFGRDAEKAAVARRPP